MKKKLSKFTLWIAFFFSFWYHLSGDIMKVKVIKVGYLECNCYILEKDGKALIIDPGDDYNKIKAEIKNKQVLGILITHHHFDHIGAINELEKDFKTKEYSYANLEEKEYQFENFNFEVIYTPGHSNDSISFYFKEEKIMFTGDFLFHNTIGRCDLEGGDYQVMLKSIKKIKQYSKDIIIYPGHGKISILEREFLNNPYFD